ncbi:LOW QUALITY PROTEIN: molybdopterin biosynthesis protein CNX1-like [Diaphorina citri]|uniref:LOW QUALITY PROTEIN: molybdopterin biosynthesis protein CNX1-like n=1 Tax=Diaphorina citri TaxID=121845 RepID=A0A3Q0IN75_DIACI|nr:LOW QUALITY PROTEIN: molybdopterin biosynthesis protein CNX1-like [Diaphorina citri]
MGSPLALTLSVLDLIPGIDIRKGATILEEGNLIGPPELGLLASVGVTSITVYKKPIIHILSTGNELDEPDAHVLKPGCIRDSNRTVLASLLSENGFSSVDKGICRDDPDLLLQCLKSNLASCDVIISTGSVSMGDKDYLKDILVTDLGASIHFGRVNMKPGKPTTFATLGNKLIFCLPGNPVSAMVTCHLFVLPALKALAGSSHPSPALLKAKLTADLSLDPERPEYHRVSLHYNPSEEHLLAYSTGHQLSSKLLSCKSCNGFAILPKATTKKTLEKNSLVNVILTKAFYFTMDQDLLELNKGVEVLLFDLNDNNDDYYILQSQSLIKTWCESNISSKLIGGHKLDVKIAIRDGKQIRGDIEKRIESEPDILFVFGGTELIHGHVTSEVCTGLIQKRITGIEFIIYSVAKSNPDLVLDQFVCGFCRKTLILTLPLTDRLTILNQIQKVLKHALAVYHNDLPSVREKHGESLVVSTASAPPLKSKINRDVTQRSRKSLYPMLEVEAAQKLILDFIETNKCGQQKQSLSCRQAGGYIVAETTVAKDDLPPFDASIKDGYAVIASDGAGKRKVVGERSAGPVKSASPLKSSQCYRINTGAPIPPGADSVVQVEDTELSKGKDGEEVEIKILKTPTKGQDIRVKGKTRPIPPGADSVVQVEDTELTKGKDGEEVEIKILKTPTKGQDIRVKGIDIRKGATILEEGNLIGPPELGLLASVGVTSITVYKKPIIHILSTGNELDEPDAHVLKPGKL